MRRGEITDYLRIRWNRPEKRDRLTMLVMVEVRTEAHTFRSQVGIGSLRLLVRTVEKKLRYFRLRCRPESRKTGRFSWRGG